MYKVIEYIQAILFILAIFIGASDESNFSIFVKTKIAALVILLVVIVLNFVKESLENEKFTLPK